MNNISRGHLFADIISSVVKLMKLEKQTNFQMCTLSPSLLYQLTSQVLEKYKVAADPFADAQTFRLSPILMVTYLCKYYSLKHNPLSSLHEIPWLMPC